MRTTILFAAVGVVLAASVARAQISVNPAASTAGSGGQYAYVALDLDNPAGTPIDAFGFQIAYPTNLLTFQSMSSAATLTQGWFVVSGSENSPGVVQVGGFHSTATTGTGVLVYAVFLVKPNALGTGAIALSDFVDDFAGATTVNGVFQAGVAPGAAGLLGHYYDNINFTGALLTRVDPVVNFDWASGAPDPSMGINDFSVRWTGWVRPAFTETYTFYSQTDDGVRVWVNNQQIINHWVDQSVTEWNGSIALTAGALVPITMEFYERGGTAVARLLWSSPSLAKQVIPSLRLQATPCAQGVGDVDGDGLLETSDAVCAFSVFLEGQQLAPGCDYSTNACELAAADANCDGEVTPGDAQAIEQRRAAGLPPAACFATAAAPAQPLQLALTQDVVDDAGTPRLLVTIAAQDAAGLDAFGGRLVFPAAELTFQRVESGYATRDWLAVDARIADAGQLRIGGYEPVVAAEPGPAVICHLYFDFSGPPHVVGGLAFSDLVDDFAGATIVGTVTAVPSLTGEYRLHQNRPNPFNPSTQIPYEVAGPRSGEHVRIAIYDVRGALIRLLVDADHPPGSYLATWDGRANDGAEVSSGVYFCSMRAGGYAQSRRMVLLK